MWAWSLRPLGGVGPFRFPWREEGVMDEVERLLGRGAKTLQPLRLAVRAGWWTLLAGTLILICGWLMGLLLIKWGAPGCVRRLWGGVSVTEFRLVWIGLLGLMKLGLFFVLLTLIWATLWLRGLRKEGLPE